MILFGFLLFMGLFALVGISAVWKSKHDVGDYLLAGRQISPTMAGLSAVASNNSGFMFIGAIGFTVQYGYSAIWLLMAWVAGDYLSWFFVHKRLRQRSEQLNTNSISSFLATNGDTISVPLQKILGLFTLIFLLVYAAAQMRAGAKALEGTLDFGGSTGIYIAACLVIAYSYAGGIRASIWTDVAQAIVMLCAMSALVLYAMQHTSLADIHQTLINIDPMLVTWTPPEAQMGTFVYALGWFVAGFCGIGQPHIIIRAMTLDKPENITTMRRVYFTWYIAFSIATFLVGLYARIILGVFEFDVELALPKLALEMMPGFFVGTILAAMFAATISTADSQVLACSASITQDIEPGLKNNYRASKLATVVVILVSTGLALAGPKSVFLLVTLAWGMLGTTIAPLMLARALRWPITTGAYLCSTVAGLLGMCIWRFMLHYEASIYEGAIGFLVTTIILFIIQIPRSLDTQEPST